MSLQIEFKGAIGAIKILHLFWFDTQVIIKNSAVPRIIDLALQMPDMSTFEEKSQSLDGICVDVASLSFSDAKSIFNQIDQSKTGTL